MTSHCPRCIRGTLIRTWCINCGFDTAEDNLIPLTRIPHTPLDKVPLPDCHPYIEDIERDPLYVTQQLSRAKLIAYQYIQILQQLILFPDGIHFSKIPAHLAEKLANISCTESYHHRDAQNHQRTTWLITEMGSNLLDNVNEDDYLEHTEHIRGWDMTGRLVCLTCSKSNKQRRSTMYA